MNYKLLKPEEVIIGPRQRIDLGNLSDLATISDPNIGQIYPILIDKDNNLIDGMRRLSYCKLNNLPVKCLVREQEDDQYTVQLLELYADIARKDRTWQERCLTYRTLHEMQPGKTVRQWAEILGESKANVAEMLNIARALSNREDKELWACVGSKDAFKLLLQRNLKKMEDEMNRRKALAAQTKPASTVTKASSINFDEIEVDSNGEHPFPIDDSMPTGDPFPALDVEPTKISLFGSTKEVTICDYFIAYGQCNPTNKGCGFVLMNRFIDFPIFVGIQKGTCATPIIWNTILGRTFNPFPFIANCKPIAFVYGSDFSPPIDNPISSLIVEPIDDNAPNSLPDGLVQTLLDTVCREGDKVRCEFRDAIAVARAGRVPVWVEPDEAKLYVQRQMLMEYYKQVLGNVEFV